MTFSTQSIKISPCIVQIIDKLGSFTTSKHIKTICHGKHGTLDTMTKEKRAHIYAKAEVLRNLSSNKFWIYVRISKT